jgi:hypothetical protein
LSDDFVVFVGEDSGPDHPRQAPLVCFVLLGLPIMNPKVQTFIYCHVDGFSESEFIMAGLPEFPCTLKLGSAVSRLCLGTRSSRKTLAHVTSDELSHRLACCVGREWLLHEVRQDICSERQSLLYVRAQGFGDHILTLGKPDHRRKPKADSALPLAVLTCLGLEFGDPEAAGLLEARRQATRLDTGPLTAAVPPRVAVEDAMLDGDCFEVFGEALDMIEGIVCDTAEAALHHVEEDTDLEPPPFDEEEDATEVPPHPVEQEPLPRRPTNI